ncbi:hypothetical protein HK405_011940, partial [Cladochytrium tenue]
MTSKSSSVTSAPTGVVAGAGAALSTHSSTALRRQSLRPHLDASNRPRPPAVFAVPIDPALLDACDAAAAAAARQLDALLRRLQDTPLPLPPPPHPASPATATAAGDPTSAAIAADADAPPPPARPASSTSSSLASSGGGGGGGPASAAAAAALAARAVGVQREAGAAAARHATGRAAPAAIRLVTAADELAHDAAAAAALAEQV